MSLQSAALPLSATMIPLSLQPTWTTYTNDSLTVLARMVSAIPTDHVISPLQIQPAGVIEFSYPSVTFGPNISHDNFARPDRRPDALRALQSGSLSIAGPVNLTQGGTGLLARLPVFINGVQPNTTFGYRLPTGLDCSIPPCFIDDADSTPGNRTGRQFWGFVTGVIPTSVLSGSDQSSLRNIERKGFHMALTRQGPPAGFPIVNEATHEVYVYGSPEIVKLEASVRRELVIPGNVWYLYLYPKNGWRSELTTPLIAMCCVLCVLLFLILATVAVHQSLYHSLLLSLMPKEAAQAVHQGLSCT